VADEDRIRDSLPEGQGSSVEVTGDGTPTPPSPSSTPSEVPSEGVEGKTEGASPSPKESSPQPSQPSGVWPKSAVDRVAKLTARLREYEARGAGAPRPIDPATGQQFTQDQINQMVNERAHLVASETAFNTRCNDAASRGASKYPDWPVKLMGLTQLVDSTDQRSVQQYNLFLEAALETGDAEGIIYRLGGNLNEAAKLLGMSPIKMALEIGKMGEARGKEPSKAPKPIRPTGSNSPVSALKPDDPDAEMSIEDWMKARNKQVSERRIR
jgi:hypothetical protein